MFRPASIAQSLALSLLVAGAAPVLAQETLRSLEPRSAAQVETLRATLPRIIGGEPAELDEYSYAVSLRVASDVEGFAEAEGVERHFCGGSIVGRRWVLTAAHCAVSIYGQADLFRVGAHGTDLDEMVEYRIEGVWLHPRYDAGLIDYDYALLKLDRETLGAVEMADDESGPHVEPGDRSLIVGWGVGDDGEIQDDLREVEVVVIGRDDCNAPDKWNGFISAQMVCLGIPLVGSRGSCSGDSGGAATTVEVPSGRPTLFGVVSWGHVECVEAEFPSVFADVRAVRGWIDSVMRN